MSVIHPEKKTAIVLFNLGGPDVPESVQPFLFNLFNDPAIIGAPNPIRNILARYISKKRAPTARHIYALLGGGSPILANTQKQAQALKEKLQPHGQTEVFICMRYWHPMSDEVVKKVKEYDPDHILLLPLYPQFSTTTTGSSFADWNRAARASNLTKPTSAIGCYPTQEKIAASFARLIDTALAAHNNPDNIRILFSAHGLPESVIKKGDPYQWQVEQTTRAILQIMQHKPSDVVNCYQSRVGPMKWIGPSTEEEIKRAGTEKKPLMIVPVAFVSEHSETLVELDIEYKKLATDVGVPEYIRVPTPSDHPIFIEGLAELCLSLQKDDVLCAASGTKPCPETFGRCICKQKGAKA